MDDYESRDEAGAAWMERERAAETAEPWVPEPPDEGPFGPSWDCDKDGHVRVEGVDECVECGSDLAE